MRRSERRQFRHELKYYLSYLDYQLLSTRLRAAMPADSHVDETGEYFIRSLYFDDPLDSSLHEKLDGVDYRDKYRVRIYNLKSDTIKLERKRKESGYIFKESLDIDLDEYYMLVSGDASFLLERDSRFARSLYAAFTTMHLMPKVIVDYWREPYTFPYEDVRITFDKHIKTAYRNVDIFDPDVPTYPALERDDTVLEVKFNNALPSYVRELIQTRAPLRSAVSKYCACRKYEL